MSAISEPRRLSVASSAALYEVLIGPGQMTQALADAPAIVIADRYFEDKLAGVEPDRLMLLDASEDGKTLDTVRNVILDMRRAEVRRDSLVLAVGGGVVQDVVTLAAQLYMRGVKWSLVPTTLLSMADSCLGGKSSINVGEVKNLAGSFYPPQRIYIDPIFVDTLTPIDRACGYLEAVKIAYCRGSQAFDSYLVDAADTTHDGISNLLMSTLNAKRWFIEVDEFDHAERRILNFGHTFGHALEAASHLTVKHGIAVGYGMLAALHFTALDRVLTNRELQLGTYVLGLLTEVVDFGAVRAVVDWEVFRAAFESDKKHSADRYILILPAEEGLGAELRELEKSASSLERVEAALGMALVGAKI